MSWCRTCGDHDCETDHATKREAAIASALATAHGAKEADDE